MTDKTMVNPLGSDPSGQLMPGVASKGFIFVFPFIKLLI